MYPKIGPYSPPGRLSDIQTLLHNAWPNIRPPSLLQALILIQHHFGSLGQGSLGQGSIGQGSIGQGSLGQEAILWLGHLFEKTPPEVEGVIEFYSFLQTHPAPAYDIKLSTNIIDILSGQQQVARQLRQGLLPLTTSGSAEALVSLSETSCTGLSDQGPAALINGFAIGNLTENRIETIIALIQSRVPLSHWPEDLFLIGNNIRRKDTLLNHQISAGQVLRKALALSPQDIISKVDQSLLRGRGGAGFRTHRKWQTCRDSESPVQSNGQRKRNNRVVVCNADEGEPGTFKDRVLLTSYLDSLLDGMTICAYAVGANRGFIYLRGEYVYLYEAIHATLQARRNSQLLGKDILGNKAFDFDIEIHLGAGAYICGEESALIESLEGRRGIPRIRPPYPAQEGYQGLPTVVNNVETFCCVSYIIDHNPEAFFACGVEDASGTKIHSVSGDCQYPGIYELPMGAPVQSLLALCGAEDTQAVQIGGAAGRMLFPDEFHLPMDFDHVNTSGSFMVFNNRRSLLEVAKNFIDFFAHESCGFCTPCRVGTTLLGKKMNKFTADRGSPQDLEEMQSLAQLINETSHCGLGHTAGNPVLQQTRRADNCFTKLTIGRDFQSDFNLEDEIIPTVSIIAESGIDRPSRKRGS